MFDETFTVIVGKSSRKKTFTLHRGVASFYSGYFEGALKRDTFKEGQEGVVKLPSESVEIFELFVRWLYTRQVPGADEHDFTLLCDLWLFADRRETPLLANTAIDKIRDEVARQLILPTSRLDHVYKYTTETAALRRFVTFIISHTGSAGLLDSALWTSNADALRDILSQVWQMQRDGTPSLGKQDVKVLRMCPYHIHETGVSCPTPPDV